MLVVAGQGYINSVALGWWSTASFGQRRMCSVTLVVVIGLGVLLRACHLAVARRWPRRRAGALQLGLGIAVLGYFVTWNLNWVGALRHGASAERDYLPTCCDDLPSPLAMIARPIYRVLGNPFQLPPSAWFAIQHGVGLDRWDHAVGMYPFVPPVLGHQDGSYRRVQATWKLTCERGAPWLIEGFGPPQTEIAPRGETIAGPRPPPPSSCCRS